MVWREITEELQKNGYTDVNPEALDRKMRNLKQTYKTVKDNNKKTGRGSLSWPYYTIMEEIFADDLTVNPGATISSFELAEYVTTNETCILSSCLPPSPQMPPSPYMPPSPQMPTSPYMPPSPEVPTSPDEAHFTDTAPKNTVCSSYRQRKEMIELEKKRVAAIERIEVQLAESVQVQKERNEI